MWSTNINKRAKRRRAKSSPSNKQKDSVKRLCQNKIEGYFTKKDTSELSEEVDSGADSKSETTEFNCSVSEDQEQVKDRNTIVRGGAKDMGLTDTITVASQQLPQRDQAVDNMAAQLQQQMRTQETLLQQILDNQQQAQNSLADIEAHLKNLDSSVVQHASSLNLLDKRVSALENNRQSAQASNSDVTQLAEQLNRIERKQRERNLRLIGIGEKYRENCIDIVCQIIYEELRVDAVVEVAHRTGKKDQGPRHIILRVGTVQQKLDILMAQRRNHGSGYFFTEDYTHKDYAMKRAFKPQIDRAREENRRWRYKNGSLYIDGREVQLEQSTKSQVTYAQSVKSQSSTPIASKDSHNTLIRPDQIITSVEVHAQANGVKTSHLPNIPHHQNKVLPSTQQLQHQQQQHRSNYQQYQQQHQQQHQSNLQQHQQHQYQPNYQQHQQQHQLNHQQYQQQQYQPNFQQHQQQQYQPNYDQQHQQQQHHQSDAKVAPQSSTHNASYQSPHQSNQETRPQPGNYQTPRPSPMVNNQYIHAHQSPISQASVTPPTPVNAESQQSPQHLE